MHKGSAGRVLVVAGSSGMAGAAVLAAGAALRGGAGLVYVSADEALWPVIQTHEPCAICVGRRASCESTGGYDAVAIGPGLGTDGDAAKLVDGVLRNRAGALVVDADALNIIASGRAQADLSGAQAVITPHPGEAARLLGVSAADIQADRRTAAARLAKEYGAAAVLKGKGSLVATPSSDMFENTTGNPGMATGGAGDVLTGLIAAFAARGMSAADAATAGVFIHGLAGDIAADEKGEYGLIATDIVNTLPAAIKRVSGR
jgi:NAD(P)H-hydrate epimerase